MQIINARLRKSEKLYTIDIKDGVFQSINEQSQVIENQELSDLDYNANGNLVCAPFVEPHIHLDAAATVGPTCQNRSGTLFEGIELWGKRKLDMDEADVRQRALATIELMVSKGVQFVRTHADVTDPRLFGLKALCDLRDELADKITLQVVAFPQEGIYSYPNGDKLMEEALEYGADVVGGIPHFEYTRELGEESMKTVVQLALKYDRLVDVHCDEIDDPNSRFLEFLAFEAMKYDIGERVTASHTTAMHSYNNAYCSKLFRLLKRSGINFISCPTESLHLQGRFDSYPKIRGLTRVKEINKAGMNVCFAQDSIADPWYSLGNGSLLRSIDFALHICHMMGQDDFDSALDFITDNGAKTLNISEQYGIAVGKPANFIVLDGDDDYTVIRKQAEVLASFRKGEALMRKKPAEITHLAPLLS